MGSLQEGEFCHSGILDDLVSDQRSCKPMQRKETHKVDIVTSSGNNVIHSIVDGIRWHNQSRSDTPQKGQASR